MSAYLWTATFQEPPQPVQRVKIAAPVRVGRESTCDVVLAGIGISREHLRLEPSPNGVLLTDLGSTNGTYLNGNRVTGSVELREGDTVVLGDTKLSVSRS